MTIDDLPYDPDRPTNGISYKDAALLIGCDDHWIRMRTNRGQFSIVARVEVRPNVLKVYIDYREVQMYIEHHRVRSSRRVRLTPDEWLKFDQMFPGG